MYEELGLEVRLEEVKPEDAGQCVACYQEATKKFIESM